MSDGDGGRGAGKRSSGDGADKPKGKPGRGGGGGGRGKEPRGGGGGKGGGGGGRGRGKGADAGASRQDGGGGKKPLFEDYLPLAEVERLEAEGRIHRGKIRINPKNFEQAFVPGGKRFVLDVAIPDFQSRNRALEGDEVAVLLNDPSEWAVADAGNLAHPLRLRSWKDPSALPARFAANPERVVRCAPLSPGMEVAAHGAFAAAGVGPAQVDVGDDGTLHILCNDEAQARAVMAADGLRGEGGGQLSLTRGDGPLLPLGEVPDRFVQAVGKVVAVVEPASADRTFCGTLRPFSKRAALFVSKDHRVPRVVVGHDACPAGFAEDPKRFATVLVGCRITAWPPDGPYAKGVADTVVGDVGEVKAEVKAILVENDVDDSDFPPSVLSSLPTLDGDGQWHIPEDELARRRDLREQCIFTIDPATARDLDDALSYRELDGGGYEIGVHIADVTFFLKPETELYRMASRRATSTYLVNKCYPMLPRLLCENLCSLAENEDRLAFSVIWRFDAGNQVVDEWFGRTVIRSCVKLAYEQAQAVIEDSGLDWAAAGHPPVHGGHAPDAIKAGVVGLDKVAKRLRAGRFASGALRLDKIKVSFKLDPKTGLPASVSNYTTRDSNKLVEEFMLMANMAVARRIYKHFPKIALLRRHEPPLDNKLEEVVEQCRQMGFEFEAGSSAALHRSLQALSAKMDEVQFRTVQLLCMGPMQVAQYVCTGTLGSESEARHFALSVPLYTHFTSPIRRMADVVVHSLLDATITGAEPWHTEEKVRRQARVCNDRNAAAKKAQEASEELFLCLYIEGQGAPVREQACVVRAQDRSLDVLTLGLGVETRVRLDDMAALEMYEWDKAARAVTLLWKDGRRDKVAALSKVWVDLTVARDGPKADVVATIVQGGPEGGAAADRP